VDTVDLAKNHLKSTGHKLKYLSKHFPTIKRVHFGDKNTQNKGMLENLVDKLTLQNVPMKVKIVIGLKLFKRKMQEIKNSIDNSTHFVEDESLVEELCGKQPKQTRMDQYDSIFEELEKEEESTAEWDRDKQRGGSSSSSVGRQRRQQKQRRPRSSSRSPSPFTAKARRIDDVPLDYACNPANEPPPPAIKTLAEKSVSPPRDKAGSKSAPIIIGEDNHQGSIKKDVEKSRSRSRSKVSRRSPSPAESLSSLSSLEEISEVKSKSSKTKKDSSMSPNKKADEEMDELVEDFLKEEAKMLSFMETEKRRFLAKPESHRDYTPEWNYFYEKMCHRERAKVHPSMVKHEWEDHWEKFVSKDYRFKNLKLSKIIFMIKIGKKKN